MITQRFNLFHAGYAASVPNLYFSKQKIKDTQTPLDNEEIQSGLTNYFNGFEKEKEACFKLLLNAVEFAKDFEIHVTHTPASSSEYDRWFDDLVHDFEEQFPMARIEHYYFLYARRIGDLLKNMGLISTYIDLHLLSKQKLDHSLKIENNIKDCEFIVFKLMAPAALLSSEPRQSCFNHFYKEMCEEIKVFKDLNLTAMNEAQFLKLKTEAINFSDFLEKGYGNCVNVLKELIKEGS